jgi:hypothetical protein
MENEIGLIVILSVISFVGFGRLPLNRDVLGRLQCLYHSKPAVRGSEATNLVCKELLALAEELGVKSRGRRNVLRFLGILKKKQDAYSKHIKRSTTTESNNRLEYLRMLDEHFPLTESKPDAAELQIEQHPAEPLDASHSTTTNADVSMVVSQVFDSDAFEPIDASHLTTTNADVSMAASQTDE